MWSIFLGIILVCLGTVAIAFTGYVLIILIITTIKQLKDK